VTGQFLTRDPFEALTRQPYPYAFDNPLNLTNPSGLEAIPSETASAATARPVMNTRRFGKVRAQ
jgi:hypothetical protein